MEILGVNRPSGEPVWLIESVCRKISIMGAAMRPAIPTVTDKKNVVSGVYVSACHPKERTILEGQTFPRCGSCNKPTAWIYLRPARPKVNQGT